MPTQEEELRLTVNLVDNASAGLAKLREEMQQIGGGAGGQAVEKFKRDQLEVNKVVKQFTGELGESFKAFGALRLGLGAGATALGLFGAEVVRQINQLKDYSDKIRAIGIAARQIGADPGVLRNLIDQFESVGLSSDEVVSSLGNVREKIGELQREGSELWSKMVGEAGQVGSRAQASMNQFLQQLTQARSDAERLNMIRQAGENIYQNRLRDTQNQQEAINARNQFWANLGYSSRLAEIKQVQELTAAERQRQTELAKAAKDYADALDKTKKTWSDIVDISNKPMLENLKATLDYINPMLEKLRSLYEWMDSGPKPPPGLTGLTDRPEIERLPGKADDGFLTRFGDWWSNAPKTDAERKKAIEDNTKALQEQRDVIKELNDRIKQGQPGSFYNPSSFPGSGPSGGLLQQATFRPPSGGAPMFGGGGGSWGGSSSSGGAWQGFGGLPSGGGAGYGPGRAGIPQREGGAPYGSSTGGPTGLPGSGPQGDPNVPSDILAQAKRVALESGPGGVERFMAQNGYPKAGAWCGEFAASVVKSVGGTPPKGAAIASNWRNWGTPVETPQPGDVAIRRGAPTGSTGSHVTFVESVDPSTGKFTGLGGNQGGGRLTSSRFNTSRYEFRRGGLPNGSDVGAGTGIGAGATPADTSAGKIPGGGGAVDAAIRSTAGAAGMPEAHWKAIASIESSLNPSSNINARTQYKGLFQVGRDEWASTGSGNIYNPQDNAEAAARLAQANNTAFKRRFGRDPTPTETYMMHQQGLGFYTRGKMTNVAGNPYPGMSGAQTPASFEAGWGREIDRRAAMFRDRDQIDRSQATTAKVEGTGKISVDVNAPKGTNVSAEGGGLFKNVEVSRQTQMESARRGPAELEAPPI